jgi:hypothetical protein
MHRQFIATFAIAAWFAALPAPAQDPDPKKGPDKEVAEHIDTLKDVVADKKCARDAEGTDLIDKLLIKVKAGVDPKDQASIIKALDGVFTQGKLRPHDRIELYRGAAAALGFIGGEEAAKVLKAAYDNKRFPNKPDWVPLREQLLKNLGRTKDESMVKFLIKEASNNTEAALQAAAGEALGNFEESKEALRKEIVSGLLIKYGELTEKASQPGSNLQGQNAQDRLAALTDKWNSTLAKLTRQNFTAFADWQNWHNKNKSLPW